MADVIQGIHVLYSADGTSYTEISEPTGFPELEEKPDYVETTPINITDRHRRYIEGLIDAGETSFEANYKKAEAAAIRTLTGTSYWRIEFDDDDEKVEFSALASVTVNSGAAGDLRKMTINLRTNSKPTWSATS